MKNFVFRKRSRWKKSKKVIKKNLAGFPFGRKKIEQLLGKHDRFDPIYRGTIAFLQGCKFINIIDIIFSRMSNVNRSPRRYR